MTIYEIYTNAINLGGYNAEEMEQKIEEMYACGKISAEERIDLLNRANENANDLDQLDIPAKLAELEARIAAVESKGVVTWVAGMSVKKGQTVLYDIDSDGALDYVRYDGGRSYTTLRPGKIEGWVKTDADGNATHTIEKDSDGNIILVPIEAAPEQ